MIKQLDSPILIPGLPPILRISAGCTHALARDRTNRVWSFGSVAVQHRRTELWPAQPPSAARSARSVPHSLPSDSVATTSIGVTPIQPLVDGFLRICDEPADERVGDRGGGVHFTHCVFVHVRVRSFLLASPCRSHLSHSPTTPHNHRRTKRWEEKNTHCFVRRNHTHHSIAHTVCSRTRSGVARAHAVCVPVCLECAALDSGIVFNGWKLERHKGAIASSAELDESDTITNASNACQTSIFSLLTLLLCMCRAVVPDSNLHLPFIVLRCRSCRII